MIAVAGTILGSALLNTFSNNLEYIAIPIVILTISIILYIIFAYLNNKI